MSNFKGLGMEITLRSLYDSIEKPIKIKFRDNHPDVIRPLIENHLRVCQISVVRVSEWDENGEREISLTLTPIPIVEVNNVKSIEFEKGGAC